MDHQKITIREAVTEHDIARFFQELSAYFQRDIFPTPEEEALAYFLGEEYRSTLRSLHDRAVDPIFYLFFSQGGEDIGFAMPALYPSEDGKCFLMEFCVFPPFRGNGTGAACAAALLAWAKTHGAQYFELRCSTERRIRFWERCGFLKSGVDECGEALMLLPPEKSAPIPAEALSDAKDPH